MYGARLHKTSRRDAVARDPKRDLLGRDRDILLRDETRDVSTETTCLMLKSLNKHKPNQK